MKRTEYAIKTKVKKSYLIALLSDLHSKPNYTALQSLRDRKPDIIAICGDLVDTSLIENSEMIRFLESCISITYTVLSLGNHDYLITDSDIELMKKLGVHVLNDEWTVYNDEISIGGLTSAFFHKCRKYDPKAAIPIHPEVAWLDEFAGSECYKILLDHHPENYEPYTKSKAIDLILSGHNHGGQIRLFGRGVYARNQGLFPKYDGGFFDNRLVVGRGLSNTMPVPRLWNPVELVYITLHPCADEYLF